jgi:hypothetical protein
LLLQTNSKNILKKKIEKKERVKTCVAETIMTDSV